jgi:hypothetical protein
MVIDQKWLGYLRVLSTAEYRAEKDLHPTCRQQISNLADNAEHNEHNHC